MKPRRFFPLAAGAFLLAAGCGGGAKPVKTEGVVTLEGQPVANATVTFSPAEGNGRAASGLTDDQGKFDLTTFNTRDGALPGDYKVTVKVGASEDSAFVPPAGNEAMRREGFQKALKAGKEQAAHKNKIGPGEIHDNYTTPAKTPLRAKVPADGPVQVSLKKNGT